MTVSIVTQTTVRPEYAEDFARWQGETTTVISRLPGFIEQRLMPPNPPLQVDWVILQRFATLQDAQRWLGSPERQSRLEGAAPMLIGRDDVHIVRDDDGGIRPAPVSAVISTRVRPGMEEEYRAWERRIAVAQSRAPGLQGYRFEPPVPGVQEDFVAILRFDSEANLQAWLASPVRKKFIEEAEQLTVEFHARMARTGFELWFRDAGNTGGPPALWKMDMLVLLIIYPLVFLWGVWIGMPFLSDLSIAVSLFIGNIAIVGLTGYLIPWVARRFEWWLRPVAGRNVLGIHLLGAAIIVALYAAMVAVFWRFF